MRKPFSTMILAMIAILIPSFTTAQEKVLDLTIVSVPYHSDFFAMSVPGGIQLDAKPVATMQFNGDWAPYLPLILLFEDGTLFWLRDIEQIHPPYRHATIWDGKTHMQGPYMTATLTDSEMQLFFDTLKVNEVFEKRGAKRAFRSGLNYTEIKIIHEGKFINMETTIDFQERDSTKFVNETGVPIPIPDSPNKELAKEEMLSQESLGYREFRMAYFFTREQLLSLIPEDEERISEAGYFDFKSQSYDLKQSESE